MRPRAHAVANQLPADMEKKMNDVGDLHPKLAIFRQGGVGLVDLQAHVMERGFLVLGLTYEAFQILLEEYDC